MKITIILMILILSVMLLCGCTDVKKQMVEMESNISSIDKERLVLWGEYSIKYSELDKDISQYQKKYDFQSEGLSEMSDEEAKKLMLPFVDMANSLYTQQENVINISTALLKITTDAYNMEDELISFVENNRAILEGQGVDVNTKLASLNVKRDFYSQQMTEIKNVRSEMMNGNAERQSAIEYLEELLNSV